MFTTEKKGLVIVMVIILMALLGLCQAAGATGTEEKRIEVAIDYEGVWVPFEQYGFQLYMPNDWMTIAGQKDVYFSAVNLAASYGMWIEVIQNAGFSMDDLLLGLARTEDFTHVTPLYLNNVAFVGYDHPENNLRGYVTLTADATTVLFFKFTPADEVDSTNLSEKIMASLSPLSMKD